MTGRLTFPLALLVALSACGEADDSATPLALEFRVAEAQTTAMDCPDRTELAGATATLYVSGGFPACSLTVGADLSASGTCADLSLPTQTIRWVLLTFEVPDPAGGAPYPLLLLVDTLDLTESALAEATDGVLVKTFEQPAIVTPEAIDALPNSAGSSDDPLTRARAWAKEVIGVRGWSLDSDGDTCANLAEACSSQLFSGTMAACP